MDLPILFVRVSKAAPEAPDRHRIELVCAAEQPTSLANGFVSTSAFAAIATNLAQDGDLQTAGEALFDVLDKSGIGAEWRRVRAKYEVPDNGVPQGNAVGLRTIFELPLTLHPLPWERLAEVGDVDRVRFFMRPTNPCSRRLPNLAAGVPRGSPDWSLRVLVIVAAKEQDLKIQWREEVAAVRARARELRHAIDVDLLLRPSLATVRARLATSYDIIHFIGHGLAGKTASDGKLILDSETGVEEWTAEDIKADLKYVPRFAFLNACETGAAGGSSWHAAHAFVLRGTPYVLAMTGDLPAKIGVTVSKSFYADLANGVAPDVAAANMREVIRLEHGGIQADEWSIPCLFALATPAPLAVDSRRACEATLPFAPVTPMIDRFPERQQLLDVLRAKSSAVVVVEGDARVGKSALVTYCLERLQLAQQSLSYVDFGKHHPANWLELIRLIRKANAPPRAFDRFHHAIKYLLRGKMPPAFDGAAHDDDEAIKLDITNNDYPQTYREDSWAALVEGMAPVDHVLALDAWRVSQHAHDELAQFFLAPIAARKEAGLRVVVLTSDTGKLKLPNAAVVRVEPFGPSFSLCAVEELCAIAGLVPQETSQILDIVRTFRGNRWDASTLERASSLVTSMLGLPP